MLTALALTSVPIVIHLLNRRRFVIVDWAPMKYLQLTLKTNRRRLRIEQILLLLLRVLLIAFLALALARPASSDDGFGAWLAGSSRADRIIVIDDSMSMAYEVNGRSAFSAAIDAASRMIDQIGPQDSLTLLTTSDPTNPMVRGAHIRDPAKLAAEVSLLSCTHTSVNWDRTLESVVEYLQQAVNADRQIVLITDLQRSGWTASAAKHAEAIAERSAVVHVIDAGRKDVGNAVVIDLQGTEPFVLVGQPAHFAAIIRNNHDYSLSGRSATFTAGGQIQTVDLPEIEAGQMVELPLQATFRAAGRHAVRIELPGDAQAFDNARHLVVDVRRQLDITLVDGEPSDHPFDGETDFLHLAFSVSDAPWRIRRITDSEWFSSPLGRTDLVVLANVASIPSSRAVNLERMVRSGVGLMIFPGDQIDPAEYNEAMHRGGEGVLPALLEELSDQTVSGLVVEEHDDSPLDVLSQLAPGQLDRIHARRIMTFDPSIQDAKTARILARWNDEAASPAIVENRCGRGRVVYWSVTADKQWSDWPVNATYVLAVRECAKTISRRAATDPHVTAGQPISHVVESAKRPRKFRVISPTGKPGQTGQIERKGESAYVLHHRDTRTAGFYALSWSFDEASADSEIHLYAANPQESESDPARIEPTSIRDWMSGVRLSITNAADAQTALSGDLTDLWKTLAWIVFAAAVVETPFAAWVGRRR
jgi:hypothetical protein